jgi:hypothetical protein
MDARGPPDGTGRWAWRRWPKAAAVVSLAGGAGSRWTQGAGVVKALHPFASWGTAPHLPVEVHLAKSRRAGRMAGRAAEVPTFSPPAI